MTEKKDLLINIACADLKITESLSRYLTFCLGFGKIFINPLKNPYKILEAKEIAEKSDFLIVDALINGEPKGFGFACEIGKKTLLLFYSGELDIEEEGPFWLVLPNKLGRLREKITELLKKASPGDSNYIELGKKFFILRATKSYHE